MLFLKNFCIGSSLFLASFSYAGAKLSNVLWVCNIPCETNDEPALTLMSEEFAWCGSTVLTNDFLLQATSACQKRNKNPNARAKRVALSSMATGDCVTAGKQCATPGYGKVSYACATECPGEYPIVKYATCTYTRSEAWEAAKEVCPGATMPRRFISPDDVCISNGQTPCQ